jgi:hypothetical protein
MGKLDFLLLLLPVFLLGLIFVLLIGGETGCSFEELTDAIFQTKYGIRVYG